MSDWKQMCDAIATELTTNVAALANVKVHKLEPWDPEELLNDGARHIGIWPTIENAEGVDPEGGGHIHAQNYVVLYWEPAILEGTRLVRDEAATEALMDLHNAIRDRFYIELNQLLGGADRLWYSGTSFAERVVTVRWFAIGLSSWRYQSFT